MASRSSSTPKFITSNALSAAHGFFGTPGGVSVGRFESLNCGALVGDDPAAVAENRARVASALNTDQLYIIKQIHSADCFTITQDATPDENTQGDALVTDIPGIALGVLSADCVPVLFDGGHVIGAAHAGWGGAVKGVLESTLNAMKARGAKTIRAAIGPAIAHQSYEVSHGFEKPFVDEDESAVAFFTPGAAADKLMFDLPGYCAFRLKRAGVETVDLLPIDVCPANSGYFSHRRATIAGEPTPGRQVSAISLKRA